MPLVNDCRDVHGAIPVYCTLSLTFLLLKLIIEKSSGSSVERCHEEHCETAGKVFFLVGRDAENSFCRKTLSTAMRVGM